MGPKPFLDKRFSLFLVKFKKLEYSAPLSIRYTGSVLNLRWPR